MIILALDVATRTGFAIGEAGKIPRSDTARLKKPGEDVQVAWRNIGFLLRDMFVLDKPDLIVVEAPMHPTAQKSPDAVVLQWGAVSVVTFIGAAYEIPIEWVNAQTVSKHFVGQSRFSAQQGGRDAKKKATIQRAQLLGYIPKDCRDDDRADACAVFDYASARWGRVRPSNLVMFGERA